MKSESDGRQVPGRAIIERDVMVPMRDGVRLATDVFRPAVEGRYPVLVSRHCYGKRHMQDSFLDVLRYVEHGYVVIFQDSRGRFGSEGVFYPLHCEIEDGYDTIEWAAAQAWCDQRIGTFGASYVGLTQWLAATARPSHLIAMVPATTIARAYGDWAYRTGGVLNLPFAVGWSIVHSGDTADRLGIEDPVVGAAQRIHDRVGELLATDPSQAIAELAAMDDLLGPAYGARPLRGITSLRKLAPWFRDWLDHPAEDAYWDAVDIAAHHHEIDVPVLHLAGWYDCFLAGTLANFVGMREGAPSQRAREGQRLIVGPWVHQVVDASSTRAGEVDFGPEAGLDLQALQERWFDHWLKDEGEGLRAQAPVRLFVMGENAWRDESEWPLARTEWTRFYLHGGETAGGIPGGTALAGDPGGGGLSPAPPAVEAPDRYRYDPADPVPSCGGTPVSYGVSPGCFDQREVECRPDVLVYTSAALEHDLEVTGPVTVTLWAATSARDTDFTAKLVDVNPDGRALNLCDGIVRGRHRESVRAERLLTPGTAYPFAIDLWATSNLFRRGHRIRLEISSSSFPSWEPNPNTGRSFATDGETVVAEQSVFHEPGRESFVLLPVIPRES